MEGIEMGAYLLDRAKTLFTTVDIRDCPTRSYNAPTCAIAAPVSSTRLLAVSGLP